jgi:hypothetical protein
MKRFLFLLLALGLGMVLGRNFDGVGSTAEAGGGQGGSEQECAAQNGDVNADGNVDISDGVTILGHLFLGYPTELVSLCTASAERSGLPDTGQTTCYRQEGDVIDCTSDTCAGQDGFYATGCPSEGRFVDNEDGTVTDTCTGLMWEKETGNGGNRTFWCRALEYCENLDLGGHDDWRLPNVREIQSIVDYGRHDPSIDPVFGALSFFYWSSTTDANDNGSAWTVNFSDLNGINGESDVKENDNHVRAVRIGG